ncbi:unnamed protein product [Caretta caretta]
MGAATLFQALQKVLPELLDAMLGNLLVESPATDMLHYILENSAEFPSMGHHVQQLGLFVNDPAKDISWQARERIYCLYQLLLHQRGLRKVLLGGVETILPLDGSAGHPRPLAACQPDLATPHLLLLEAAQQLMRDTGHTQFPVA